MELTVEDEKRTRKRFSPEGLNAHITIDPPPPEKEIIINGVVVDMSYGGIKIKLDNPLAHDVEQAELRITIRLPESGVPLSIHGMIRHISDGEHCGMQYAERHSEEEMDSLMFECVRLAPHCPDE